MALLEITNLSRNFDGVMAVSDVSFVVNEGETVSVIGPNGAGKTTLFNLITGLDRATQGDIRFDGESLIGLSAEEFAARGIARTFQHGRVFGNLSVRDNVLLGAHTRRKAAQAKFPLLGIFRELGAALLQPPSIRSEDAQLRQE